MNRTKVFLILLINAFCSMRAVAASSFTMVGVGSSFVEAERMAERDAHQICPHPARQNDWKLSRSGQIEAPYQAEARFKCIVLSYEETDSPFQEPIPAPDSGGLVN